MCCRGLAKVAAGSKWSANAPGGYVPKRTGLSASVLDHGDVRMGSFRDFSMHCRAGLADVWAKNTATGALPGAIKAFAAAAEGMDGSLRRDRAQLVDKRRQEMGDEPKRPSVMGGPCRAARAYSSFDFFAGLDAALSAAALFRLDLVAAAAALLHLAAWSRPSNAWISQKVLWPWQYLK